MRATRLQIGAKLKRESFFSDRALNIVRYSTICKDVCCTSVEKKFTCIQCQWFISKIKYYLYNFIYTHIFILQRCISLMFEIRFAIFHINFYSKIIFFLYFDYSMCACTVHLFPSFITNIKI